MEDHDYKRYTKRARRGIKGEAFFETLIVDHAIPHRIARQNDLGVDFLCEWIYGDRPTGILFSAQVKATTKDEVKCRAVEISDFNGLLKHTLIGAKKIDERTINYWKGLGLPAFLFYVIENGCNGETCLECYHKRYTPLLDGHSSPDDESGSKSFFKVSNGSRFLAFADFQKEIGGFARDLIMDYVRLSYSKGHVVQLTPSQLGFWPFLDKERPYAVRLFENPLRWHQKKIKETCEWTTDLLNQLPAPAEERYSR